MRPVFSLSACALAFVLAACPQTIRGSGDEGGGGSGGTGTGTSDAGSTGNQGGSDAGTITGGGTLEVTCTRAGAATLVSAGQPVEIDCTLAGGSANWSVAVDPSWAYVANELGSRGKAYVTLRPGDVPFDFAGGRVRVTITASAGGKSGQATVGFDALGNVLLTNASGGVGSFRTDGTQGRDFIGAAKVAKPTLLQRLSDGSLLVGSVAGAGTPVLRRFDRHGALLADFKETSTAGEALWAADSYPYGAAEDPTTGNVYVSKFVDAYHDGGQVYLFAKDGSYLQTLPPPTDLTQHQFEWVPTALAILDDHTLVVANGAGIISSAWVALYPPGGTGRHVKLPFRVCDPGGGANPSCRDNGDSGKVSGLYVHGSELFVALDIYDGATLAAYANPDLTFLRSTQHKDGSSYGFWNLSFGNLVQVGDVLVVTMPRYGCPIAVDPVTLYVPDTWRDQNNGCWTSGVGSSSTLRGVALLAP